MSQRTTLSQLGTQLETALQTSTVTQGRVRYVAGQAFVDSSEARAEQYPFTTLKQTNRDATWDSEQRLLAESLRINVSPDALSALVACLRQLLENYIDKAADRIGHGFPIVGGSHGYTRALRSGLATRSYETPLSRFAESLVRASIAIGSERVAQLIGAWMDGGPLRMHTSAILSGVAVAEEITLPQGLAVRMLPRVSELLPLSVPRTTNLPVMDLLGATVLTIDSTIDPPLFRPGSGTDRASEVEFRAADQFRSVRAFCDALAVISGQFVRPKRFWVDYGEIAVFGPRDRSLVWGAGEPFSEPWRETVVHTDASTGVVTLRRRAPEPPLLSESDVHAAWAIHASLEERKANHPRFKTAIDRWLRSRRPDLSPADHFIDLRVALEALYLGDASGRLRFRLSTRLAGHLGTSPDERKQLYETVGTFYARASRVVHGSDNGDADDDRRLLEQTSDLCRRGLLAYVRDAPSDWDTLVFGT